MIFAEVQKYTSRAQDHVALIGTNNEYPDSQNMDTRCTSSYFDTFTLNKPPTVPLITATDSQSCEAEGAEEPRLPCSPRTGRRWEYAV